MYRANIVKYRIILLQWVMVTGWRIDFKLCKLCYLKKKLAWRINPSTTKTMMVRGDQMQIMKSFFSDSVSWKFSIKRKLRENDGIWNEYRALSGSTHVKHNIGFQIRHTLFTEHSNYIEGELLYSQGTKQCTNFN